LKLAFTRDLATDAATAWTLLADPAAMNTWSTARITSVERGDGDHPGGVGALRRVQVPRGGALVEVIERSTAPYGLEYRVIAGAPVKRHRGVIAITPSGSGVRVTWTVEIEPLLQPILQPVMRALLVRELERSLDRLVAVAPATRATPLPPPRTLDTTADVPALRRAALAVAAGQGDLADALAAAGDPRAAFARVYHHVTTASVAAAHTDRFEHPAWIYRLVPVFDDFFTAAIAAPAGLAEPHWQRAFDRIGRVAGRGATRFEIAMHAVHAGMRAHIEGDLPRTLARVHREHYAGACSPARFRADYLAMSDVFEIAGAALMAEFPRGTWTPRARIIDVVTPQSWRAGLIDRHFYPITRERARAFQLGALLATSSS
jgi:hypothetical protein